MDYSHLSDIQVVLPPEQRFAWLRRALFGNPVAARVAAQHRAVQARNAKEKKTRDSVRLANAGVQNAAEFGSGYGYEDDLHEVSVAINYKKEIDAGYPGPSDSRNLYKNAEQTIASLIDQSRSPIDACIDFGVSYAYTDSLLAARFPTTRFIGLDRSVLTKALNQRYFGHQNNLDILATDIFDYLDKVTHECAILWTMRTAAVLPKPFLERLYQAARGAGVKHICLFEPIGLSRETLQPYVFSDRDQPSVAYRHGMFIHNYPGILKSAGYTVNSATAVAMGHPHPDVKIISIIASL